MSRIKPIYSMSGVGGCPRAVVAQLSGYEAKPDPEFLKNAAREGNRHEAWIAEDLKERGLSCSREEKCSLCSRNGIHVEITNPAYSLYGHIDRFVTEVKTGKLYLGEFKALSRFRSEALIKSLQHSTFRTEFREYAMQVSCYHWATNLPILYAVKNRDTGSLTVFKDLEVPFSIEEIDSHISGLELLRLKDKLPVCVFKPSDFERKFCKVRYMCAGEGEEKDSSEEIVGDDTVRDAVAQWRAARVALDAAQAQQDAARAVLASALRVSKQHTLTLFGLRITLIPSVSYTTYPKNLVEKEVPPSLLSLIQKINTRDSYIKIEEI